MNSTQNAVQRLTGAFVALLHMDLTREQFFAMRVANASAGEGACASHDHCDANMVMAEAFRLITGRAIDTDAESDLRLWNEAWHTAKGDHLTDGVTSIETMTAEYADWCKAQGVDHVDAEELALYDTLTGEQRGWLAWFICRWEIVQQIEDDQRRAASS
jgi:hypothetical protein